MSKHTSWKTGALIILLAATAGSARGENDGGWWGDLFQEKTVTLEQILERPHAFKDQTVSFVAQFHRLGKIDNPFFTKFESAWYLNFSVWSDSSAIWDRKTYINDFQYLFIRRGTPESKAILKAPLYTRYAIVAEISAVFKGKPWLEVKGLQRLDTQMNEASLIHIVKGRTLSRIHRYAAAAKSFRSADHESLPVGVRAMVMSDEATALSRLGKTEPAVRRLETAVGLTPDNKELRNMLDRLRALANERPAKKKGTPAAKSGAPATNKKNPATGSVADASSKDRDG